MYQLEFKQIINLRKIAKQLQIVNRIFQNFDYN